MKELHEGLSRPRTHKKMEKIWARIGRLKAHSSGAGQHYHIEVTADESGQQATAVSWELRPVAGSKLTHPGVYCLRSNQTDWDARDDRSYIMLTDPVFRSLKSEHYVAPDFPEQRRQADICVITVPPSVGAVIPPPAGGEHSSWHTLRSKQRVTATFRRADASQGHLAEEQRGAMPWALIRR